LEEEATGSGDAWPTVQANAEAFFKRRQGLHWQFFATRYDAFVTRVLPKAPPSYAHPLHALRVRFAEVRLVDG
jgi:hypothetical protein